MARVPVAGEMTTSPISPATMQALEEQRRKAVEQQTGGDAVVSYTIVAGNIKPSVRNFAVDTEAAAASDDLTTIAGEAALDSNGFPGHGLVILRAANTARTVVVKHLAGGTYDIDLHGNADFSIDDDQKRLVLMLRGTRWYEVMRCYASDAAARRSYLGLTNLSTLSAPATPGDDGKYVGASAGTWTYQTAAAGGSGHKSRSLVHAGGSRNYTTGTVIRLEEVDLGTPVTDGYTFSVPSGATYLQAQVLARVEQNPERESLGIVSGNFVKLRIAYRPPGASGFDATGLGGARGLPARTFQFAATDNRLREGNLALAASMIPVAVGGQVRVQIEGDVSSTYRVLGGKTKTWLSLQWM
jgi:hypothetical protein